MKKNINLILLILGVSINAQIKNIKLLSGNEEIKISKTKLLFSLYVTNNNKIYIENREVKINTVSEEFVNYKSKIPLSLRTSIIVFLNIDSNVKYEIVDRIKTNLAKQNVKKIVYKTTSLEEKDILKGVFWTNHLTLVKKKEGDRNLNKKNSMNFSLPIPPPQHWSVNFYDSLYEFNYTDVYNTLRRHKYQCLLINNEGIIIDSKQVKFDNLKKLNLLVKSEILLIKFSENLIYKNYLKTIQQIKKDSRKKDTFFFEISFELNELFKKNSINLF